MRVFDRKHRDFYDSLDADERKKFSTYLMLRWGSSVEGERDLKEFYLIATNERFNKHFFSMSKHPKLQWLMATSVSPDLGPCKHNWIAPKKKEPGASAKRKALQEIYPDYGEEEISVMMQITTQKEIDEYFKASGKDTKK